MLEMTGGIYGTGNVIVDENAKLNISGNIIPRAWYRTILRESGKPNLTAIIILADIVYWYKPMDHAVDGRTCRSRLEGTLRGIRENLDYIQGMGFTCLYLNPVFSGGEYHKYDVLDYYHIDPCLGTEADFQELVEELHRRGMKIIIDGVFNHCSWEFFAFEDVAAKGRASRYCKWFYGLEFPVRKPENADEVPNYTCFAYERIGHRCQICPFGCRLLQWKKRRCVI